jgi:hypothetical protein
MDINQLKKQREELAASLHRQLEEDLKKDPNNKFSRDMLKSLDEKDKFFKTTYVKIIKALREVRKDKGDQQEV